MAKPPNAATATTKTRAPRTANGPRKVTVLLRLRNRGGQPIDLVAGEITVELALVSSDKRRLFDALSADRSLISLEWTYPASEAAPEPITKNTRMPLSEAAE
jgi:hypothetical protein